MAETIEKVIFLNFLDSNTSDNDAIIKVLGEKNSFYLLAQGVNKSESKNRNNLIPGALVEIEYFKARLANSTSKLKKANILSNIDLKNIENLKFLQQIILYLSNFEQRTTKIYNAYLQVLDAFELLTSVQKIYAKTFLIMQGLEYWGINPNFFACCDCGQREQIVDFRFEHGGYKCIKHAGNYRKSHKLLMLFYYAKNDFYAYLKEATVELDYQIYYELLNHIKNNGIYINWENFDKKKVK
ncbi:DNA repair protein RecO [Mycoplasmopsis columbina]|uniref:DNA repair protein RecO n=1 Tax=Mycoplasmopsis columbina TaxID=114881 RepID=UPI0004A72688|nr:DNA repair protein RecO [Mycoplasmopsis columbina]VEU76717.1 recombinational DNA repair protein O [Mycoplasmopsis columbina]